MAAKYLKQRIAESPYHWSQCSVTIFNMLAENRSKLAWTVVWADQMWRRCKRCKLECLLNPCPTLTSSFPRKKYETFMLVILLTKHDKFTQLCRRGSRWWLSIGCSWQAPECVTF